MREINTKVNGETLSKQIAPVTKAVTVYDSNGVVVDLPEEPIKVVDSFVGLNGYRRGGARKRPFM